MKDPGADDCVLYDPVEQLQKLLLPLAWRSGPKKKKQGEKKVNNYSYKLFYKKLKEILLLTNVFDLSKAFTHTQFPYLKHNIRLP